MAIPSFTADLALLPATRSYAGRGRGPAPDGRVVVMQDLYWCGDCWCGNTEDCVVLPGGRCKCFPAGAAVQESTTEMLLR